MLKIESIFCLNVDLINNLKVSLLIFGGFCEKNYQDRQTVQKRRHRDVRSVFVENNFFFSLAFSNLNQKVRKLSS